MLCAKCHRNEATIHLTSIVDGIHEETVHLCTDCGPTAFSLANTDLNPIQSLSSVGKKCEFCGKNASSSEITSTGNASYRCFDCACELGVIMNDLLVTERPDLLQRGQMERSLSLVGSDAGIQAWSISASQRATQILKERRRQDGRDSTV